MKPKILLAEVLVQLFSANFGFLRKRLSRAADLARLPEELEQERDSKSS